MPVEYRQQAIVVLIQKTAYGVRLPVSERIVLCNKMRFIDLHPIYPVYR